jgi:ribonuclease H / adenosylcobalamin/alpha-ribazole phosphatase
VWNEKRLWAGGIADIPLTDTGRQQAREACTDLEKHTFDFICSSGLQRAIETAAIIANELKINLLEPVPELNERNLGRISGMTSLEIIEKYPEFYNAWQQGNPSETPEGECWNKYHHRITQGIDQISVIHGKGLVITHMGVLRMIEYLLREPQNKNENLTGIWLDDDKISSIVNSSEIINT